jgi:hypothetical protein
MTLRYRGNTDRAIEEYRKTLTAVDRELGKCTENLSDTDSSDSAGYQSGFRRYYANLRERAANTRERLADCTFYGGAASGDFGQGRLNEAAKLYEEAAQFYNTDEGAARTMRSKLAVILLLLNDRDKAQKILDELDSQKQSLLGNQLRTELVRQVADALLLYRKNADNPAERKRLLRQFLHQFTIPSNPAGADAARRETLELRLFCAEFLVDDALNDGDFQALRRDLPFLVQPFGFFLERPGSRPFVRRICDKIVQTEALLYDKSDDPALKQIQIVGIVRLLEGMRLRTDPDGAVSVDPPSSGASRSLIVFFLTEDPKEGFVIFYPQDDRAGNLYRLPLTRKQIKGGTKKQGEEWQLDTQLIQTVQEERKAERNIGISWNDEASWARSEDALTDADWPFGNILTIEN